MELIEVIETSTLQIGCYPYFTKFVIIPITSGIIQFVNFDICSKFDEQMVPPTSKKGFHSFLISISIGTFVSLIAE